jgi:hypothetical protein
MSLETYNQRKIHMVGSNNVLEDQKHDNKSLVHNQRKLLHYTFSQWQSNKKNLGRAKLLESTKKCNSTPNTSVLKKALAILDTSGSAYHHIS